MVSFIVLWIYYPSITKSTYIHNNDKTWGIIIFHSTHGTCPDIWYGYVVCNEKNPPEEIQINYTISNTEYSCTRCINSDPDIPWWGRVVIGGNYSAMYSLINEAPSYPNITKADISTHKGQEFIIR